MKNKVKTLIRKLKRDPVHALQCHAGRTQSAGRRQRLIKKLIAASTFRLVVGAVVEFDGRGGEGITLVGVGVVELGEGDASEIEATTQAVVLFGHASPIDEPVVSHGPFVMNSADEIRQAYADYRAGHFQVPG